MHIVFGQAEVAAEEVDDVGFGHREGEPPELEDLGVLHLVLPFVGPGAGRGAATGVVSLAAGAAAAAADAQGIHLCGDGVVVVLLPAAEDLHIPATHVLLVPLEGEFGLHWGGEDDKGLAGEAPVLVGQEAVEDVQAGEELEDVDVSAVEGQASEADHGEGVHAAAARAGAVAAEGGTVVDVPAAVATTVGQEEPCAGGAHREVGVC